MTSFAQCRRCAPLWVAPMLMLGAVESALGGFIVPGFNSNTLPANDDGSTGLVSIGFSANFFGTTYTSLYVNNNGNVTFSGPLSTFTPFGLTGTLTPIIAPFFGDVDTRGAGSGLTKYGTGTYAGHTAFGVTWENVGYYFFGTNKLNSFQLIMVDRSDTGAGNFDFYFNYGQIQWETGDASGGSNGLGGSSAHAGFSNGSGDPGTSYEIAGSGVNGAFLDSNGTSGLIHTSNIGVAGQYLFTVRNGVVVPPTTVTPEPATMISACVGCALLLGRKLRKRRSCAELA